MLRPLPFRTFGEIAALGLELTVHCSSCSREAKLDPTDERLRHRCFAGARLRCTAMIQRYTRPSSTCGQPGYLYIRRASCSRSADRSAWPSCSAGDACRIGRSIMSSSTSCHGRQLVSDPTIDSAAQPVAAPSTGKSMGRCGGRRIRGPRSSRALHHGKVKPELSTNGGFHLGRGPGSATAPQDPQHWPVRNRPTLQS
jgi:hypothetical protein